METKWIYIIIIVWMFIIFSAKIAIYILFSKIIKALSNLDKRLKKLEER